MVFDWTKDKFDFPVHFHPEFELNFIQNAAGARRICGDHVGTIGEKELLLVGPNSYHCWEQGKCTSSQIHETIVLFQRDLFHSALLSKTWFKPIARLLSNAQRGVLFGPSAIARCEKAIMELSNLSGFELIPAFFSLIHQLALSPEQKILSTALPGSHTNQITSDKITLINQFIAQNYRRKIALNEMALQMKTTEITLHRLIKEKTGTTFTDLVNQFRISQAVVQLIDTQKAVTEIAHDCGFFNLANFNRTFKFYKGQTPGGFRKMYFGG